MLGLRKHTYSKFSVTLLPNFLLVNRILFFKIVYKLYLGILTHFLGVYESYFATIICVLILSSDAVYFVCFIKSQAYLQKQCCT